MNSEGIPGDRNIGDSLVHGSCGYARGDSLKTS